MDPFTFTKTEAKFRHLLESMLCKTVKHQPNCSCQELRNIYGSSIYKCGRPGCMAYRVGFDTRSKRVQHMQKHTRPFKCPYSRCPFAVLGFGKDTDLESHLATAHGETQHTVSGAREGQTNASSEVKLKAILIDAVKENDLSTIRSESTAVRKFVLVLLLQAYQGRSSDSMIKHLVGEISPNFSQVPEEDRNQEMYEKILRASTEHGNYDVFQMPCKLFNEWVRHAWYDTDTLSTPVRRMLFFIGRTRCADLLETVVSKLCEIKGESKAEDHIFSLWLKELVVAAIPGRKPDTLAEILALECLDRVKLQLSKKLLNRLLLEVAGRCCSIAIAEFLLAEGALVNSSSGGQWPLFTAAGQTNLEAAKFMELMVRKGAQTGIDLNGQVLGELPGPRNIQKWIGITWEELTKNT